MIARPSRRYPAFPIRVIDGDTVVLEIDLGFHVYHRAHVRLLDVDAPELNAPDPLVREVAQAWREVLAGIIMGRTLELESRRLDKYGRALGVLWCEGENVNATLVARMQA